MGQLMMILDATIVNVALPAIQRDLHFSNSALTWVPNAYLIAYGSFLLLGGRIGDLIGRTRMFLIGLTVFTAASVLCGVADSEATLIGARFLQGFGSAICSSAILALIVVEFPDARERMKAMSAFTFVSVAGGSIGLLAGGLLTEALSWHWIFFINVPIGILAFVLGVITLDRDHGLGLTRDIDLLGSFLITASGLVGIFAIVQSRTYGVGSLKTIGLAALTAAMLVAFFKLENRIANPILPVRIMKLRSLMIACGIRALMVCGMWASFFLGALYLERVRGFGPISTGVAFLPQTLVVATLSLGVTARLTERFGHRAILITGLSTLTVSLSLFGVGLYADTPYFPLQFIGYLLLGVGAGMSFMTLMALALADVPPEDAGVASGIVNVSVQIAAAIGLAALGTVAASRTSALQGHESSAAALAGGYRLAFGLAAGSVAAALVSTLVWLRRVKPVVKPAATATEHERELELAG